MLKGFAVTAGTTMVLAGGIAAVGGPADAAPTVTAARCHAHKVGHHWTCITPGSYCPRAAHRHYGYAYKTGKRYRCVKYSNGRWRWKRA